MMSGHGAPRLGDHVGMGQTQLLTDLPQGMDYVIGILLHAVVHGTITARARAFVIDSQTAAHIHTTNVHTQTLQLGVIACRFAHTALNVTHVRHL